MAMLVQYLSAKAGVATGQDLPELCREHLPEPVVARALGAGRADRDGDRPGRVRRRGGRAQPALPRAAVSGRADHRRGRVRHPGPRAARLSPLRAGHRRPARASSCSASCTTWSWSAPDPAGIAGGAGAAAGRQRQPAAGRRHHRRDGHAARGLPALRADQVPGVLPGRRRAAGTAALPAARRGDRARHGRRDQPVDAGGRGVAVQPDAVARASTRSRRRTPGSASSSAAARRSPSRWRCSPPGCRRRASAPTPGRSSCRASSGAGSRCSCAARLTMLPALVVLGARAAGHRQPGASRRWCCRSASRSR